MISMADLGGLGGLPAISGHTKEWMCCYKNTLILANTVIFVHNNLYLPKGCTHHAPGTILVSSFSQNFKT